MRIPRREFSASIPATAMGDIAFLLLIFFVVLARALDDSHLQWRPATARDLDPGGHAAAAVVVDRDRRTFLNGREIGVAQLAAALEARLSNREPGNRSVHLKVDRHVTAMHFEPVIEAISEAGGELVHILAPEEDVPAASAPAAGATTP